MNLNAVIIIVFSALITFLFTRKLIPIFKKILPDLINKRSIHRNIKPTGGGVVFSTILFIYVLISLIFKEINIYDKIILFSYPISIIGLIDDKINVNKRIRITSHIICSFLIIYNSPTLIFLSNKISTVSYYIFLVFLLCSIINFANFIDGLDGLLLSCIIFPLLIICFYLNNPLLILILIGSLFGFLILNWHPAKIFMGDSGSTFLGIFYSGFALQSGNFSLSMSLLLLIGPIYIDTIITIIKRLISKQNILKGHKLHLYQRLYQLGIKQSKIVYLYFIDSLFISVSFILFKNFGLAFSYIISIAGYFYIDSKIKIKFN